MKTDDYQDGKLITLNPIFSRGSMVHLSWAYKGKTIRFGKELVSWEFDEIKDLIYQLTGVDVVSNHKDYEELAP